MLKSKSFSDLKAEIAALEAQANAARHREVTEALRDIKSKIAAYGLTANDLGLESLSLPPKAKPSTGSSTAKYRDPKTNKTWTGHGRVPNWMVNAKNRDAFLVNTSAKSGVYTTNLNLGYHSLPPNFESSAPTQHVAAQETSSALNRERGVVSKQTLKAVSGRKPGRPSKISQDSGSASKLPTTGSEFWLKCMGKRERTVHEIIDLALSRLDMGTDVRPILYNRFNAWLYPKVKTGDLLIAGVRDGAKLYQVAASRAEVTTSGELVAA